MHARHCKAIGRAGKPRETQIGIWYEDLIDCNFQFLCCKFVNIALCRYVHILLLSQFYWTDFLSWNHRKKRPNGFCLHLRNLHEKSKSNFGTEKVRGHHSFLGPLDSYLTSAVSMLQHRGRSWYVFLEELHDIIGDLWLVTIACLDCTFCWFLYWRIFLLLEQYFSFD